MIQPHRFHGLLDFLAGQYFDTCGALCTGDDFGIQLSVAAKKYFSVAIIQEELLGDKAVLGVLLDDSAHVPSRSGYTLVIYIDERKIQGSAQDIFASVILAHEVCHFAFYYELFLRLGDKVSSALHNNFTHAVCGTLIGAVTQERDSTRQTLFEEHSIRELVENFRLYPKEHFSRGNGTVIDYMGLIDDFYNRLGIGDKVNAYQSSRGAL